MTGRQANGLQIDTGERFDLSFTAKDRYATPDSIFEVFGESVRMLREIDRSRSDDVTLRWRTYQLSTANREGFGQRVKLIVVAEPLRANHSRGVADVAYRGWEFAHRGAELPDDFPESAVESAVKMADALNNGVAGIRVAVPHKPAVRVDRQTQRNLHTINQQRFVFTYGSIEGSLRLLSSLKKQHFDVVEDTTGTSVHCYFDDAETEAKALAAYKKRVSVQGRIKYNREGKPLSVEVAGLRAFKDARDLPQLSDLIGIDITGGQDSVSYIRELRDDGH